MQAALNPYDIQDETVFLWQLHGRALLLDDGFQKEILSVVKQRVICNNIIANNMW
jgi:hypothetical protein